ncbi:MAG: hypothetical protein J2O44_02050, partial [Porphyrobacter sp.]|nr:hypothetical protein [Porphyrobacter sp.]
RVTIIDIDRQTGEHTAHDQDNPSEVAEFLELPRVGDQIIWQGSLDLERLEVIRVEHFPTYPDRPETPLQQTEPTLLVTAKWIWTA